MSRTDDAIAMLGDSQYSLTKTSRKHADSTAEVSSYTLTDQTTGKKYHFLSEHKPKPTAEPTEETPLMLRKRAYNPHVGSFSIVKKLQPTSMHGEPFEHAFALKCFDNMSDEDYEELRAILPNIVSAYDKMGIKACSFEYHNKLFMAMQWLGNKDMLTYMQSLTSQSKITNVQLIKVFLRFLKRIHAFHHISDSPLVDIKPDNMFPVLNKAGELIDIRFADCDNAFSSHKSFTPNYLSDVDLIPILQDTDAVNSLDARADFRTLANIFALLSYNLVDRTELYLLSRPQIFRQYIRINGQFRHIRLPDPVYRPDLSTHTSASELMQRALIEITDTLSEGKSPLQHMGDSLLQLQLICDLKYIKSLYPIAFLARPATRLMHDNPINAALRRVFYSVDQCVNQDSPEREELDASKNSLCELMTRLLASDNVRREKVMANTFLADDYCGLAKEPAAIHATGCHK